MTDLVIGCFQGYDWSKIKCWANSLVRSGFQGDKVLLTFDLDPKSTTILSELGFQVINQEHVTGNIPIHVARFFYIWKFLNETKEYYNWVITTDMRDVIFQTNPSEFHNLHPNEARFWAASESIKYKDEPWGNQNLLDCFGPYFHNLYKNNTIYNIGVLAGQHFYMRDMCMMILQMSVNRPIPIVDQAVYNFILYQQRIFDKIWLADHDYGWAAQLGTTMDPHKIKQFDPLLLEPKPYFDVDGIVYTHADYKYCIVHQYDRVPKLKALIEKIYE